MMASYKGITEFWQASVNDKITPKCGAILFKNCGDVPVVINNVWRLEPGEETPTISMGHPEVVDYSTYSVAFEVGSAGIAPLVTAIIIGVIPIKSTAGTGGYFSCENF